MRKNLSSVQKVVFCMNFRREILRRNFTFTETTPICRNMKKVTLEKVLHVLKTGENEVFVDDKLREESKKPLERMLELAK